MHSIARYFRAYFDSYTGRPKLGSDQYPLVTYRARFSSFAIADGHTWIFSGDEEKKSQVRCPICCPELPTPPPRQHPPHFWFEEWKVLRQELARRAQRILIMFQLWSRRQQQHDLAVAVIVTTISRTAFWRMTATPCKLPTQLRNRTQRPFQRLPRVQQRSLPLRLSQVA